MKLAIDAMGGDNAPEQIVKGAVDSLNEVESTLVLIGQRELIEVELAKYKYDKSRIEIVDAREVITNDDKPVNAIKQKKDSSMVVGMDLLKAREVGGLVSAGNTGALLAGGLLKIGRVKGIDRPAICTVFPTSTGFTVLTDVGANADCKARNLNEFAIMGSIYAKKVLGVENPRVGIVNIGSEKGKGSALVQESFDLMESSDKYNFIGNVEARDIMDGVADVVVTDGFTGNVILKLSEGVVKTIVGELKSIIKSNPISLLGGALLSKGLGNMKKKLDYTEYGGAPLLGIDRLLVKAHGSSNDKAFMNAIKYAEKCVVTGVIDEIESMVNNDNHETK